MHLLIGLGVFVGILVSLSKAWRSLRRDVEYREPVVSKVDGCELADGTGATRLVTDFSSEEPTVPIPYESLEDTAVRWRNQHRGQA